jgi:hypothetical protein
MHPPIKYQNPHGFHHHLTLNWKLYLVIREYSLGVEQISGDILVDN